MDLNSLLNTFAIDARQLFLLQNSLVLALSVATIATLLGSIIGFLLARTNIVLKKIVLLLMIVPLVIPPYIFTVAWLNFFYQLKIIAFKSGIEPTLSTLSGIYASIGILTLCFLPIAVYLSYFAFRNLDAHLEEAGILQQPRLRVFWRISLRLAAPVILAAFLIIFTLTITEFGTPSLLLVPVFVQEIYAQFSAFFDFARAFALSYPLLLFSLLAVFGSVYVLRKQSFATLTGDSQKPKLIRLSPILHVISLTFVVVVLTLSVVIPIYSLIRQGEVLTSPAWIFQDQGGVALLRSLLVAALSATIMMTLSLGVYNLTRRLKTIVSLPLLLPLAIPSVSIGILLIWIFNHGALQFIYSSVFLLVIGLCVKFIPFVLIAFIAFAAQFDSRLVEVAKTLGKTSSETLQKVTLPLLLPAILVSWFVGFILAVSDLGLGLLLSPPGFQTLPVRIFILVHYGSARPVAAFSFLLVFVVLLSLGLCAFLYSKLRRTYD
ncbi:iron ABC transporter permease [candidate division WWE3 bacterium]|uniref:Iron ABC transporter permease n=1 Tax=candidate division WWE3 bacterium TaxID=2053526 RepID=A0A955RS35_UNCKA|nr:iron ABC transporter permease [candidate division WWE3 bacterium]